MDGKGRFQTRLLLHAGLAAAITAAAAGTAQASDRYSAFVIDAQTHEVLHDEASDEARYPASLTKMMTLYMLFDELESGKIDLNDRMRVSRHAARAAPTKLGLKVGATIKVEDAIRALVTKSANDAAIVIAEHLGGTESNFAANMTVRARALGMSHTSFYNASGLPDARQQTTARDLAKLSERLIEDFPQYYAYFQTPGMKWGKRYAANHNKLLGQVDGVDGIKTGYTNASGYNLATAAIRDGRRVIAVVLGGETASSRDNQMAYLIENAYLTLAKRAPTAAPIQATTTNSATFTSLPVTKATIDMATGDMLVRTSNSDQVQYGVPAPPAAAVFGDGSPGAPVNPSPGQQMVDKFGETSGLF